MAGTNKYNNGVMEKLGAIQANISYIHENVKNINKKLDGISDTVAINKECVEQQKSVNKTVFGAFIVAVVTKIMNLW